MEIEGPRYEVAEPFNRYTVQYSNDDVFSADLGTSGDTTVLFFS